MIKFCGTFITAILRKTTVTVFLFAASHCLAQKTEPGYKEYFMEGSYQLLEDEPELALKNFQKAYRLDSSSANINYLLGICYLQSEQEKNRAEYYLEKAVKNISVHYKSDSYQEKAAPPLAHFYYGKALHFNYKFDQASQEFEAFRPTVSGKDLEFVKMLDKEQKNTALAGKLINYPVNVKVTNLGEKINSQYPEYSAVLSGDERTIIYTTRRPGNNGNLVDAEGKAYEDIVVSYKDDNDNWSAPIPLGINTIGHEASINLSADGQTLIVYKNEAGGTNPAGNGNIYFTVFDGKDWTSLQEFGTDVNTPYVESHACLSSDGNVLFFSSERPGGFGGKDIYRCMKLPNGNWSKALNMGPEINSEYDEDGGFIAPDGQTFYFASNGPLSMGGFDILYATLNEDNKFSNVTNIGYPINTTDDDIFYVVSPDGKRGYFSSNKELGGYGDKDIYMITLAENRETFLALFKGQILPAEGEQLPDNITIVVKDKETGELVGVYRPKPQNGTFSTILPPGKTYNFSYQIDGEQEFYNEEIFVSNEYAYQEIKREVNLEPVKIKGKIKVIQNTVEMAVQVFDNSGSKKPVAGARVILHDVNGGKQVYTSNENGVADKIKVTADRKYKLSADLKEKKSEVTEFTCPSATVAQNIQQVIYLEKAPKPEVSKEHVLDVIVKNPKTKKPVPAANVKITDANGESSELITNDEGKTESVQLTPDTKYTIVASKENFTSTAVSFTTTPLAKAFKAQKTILLAYTAPVAKPAAAESVAPSEHSLSISVKNPKTGKAIPSANVVITDASGQVKEFITDENGKAGGLKLSGGKNYTIVANKENTNGNPVIFNTPLKPSKIQKTIPLAYTAESTATPAKKDSMIVQEHSVDITVKHPKTRKPIADANVVITDANGQKTDLVTDKKGKTNTFQLLPDMKYVLMAYKDNFASEPISINSGPAAKLSKLQKTLLLPYTPAGANLATEHDSTGKRIVVQRNYTWHFAYGKKDIDTQQENLVQFVNEIVARKQEQDKITVEIESSASQVPMRKPGGNEQLAADRADNFKMLLTELLNKKGIKTDGIQFVVRSSVKGPAYQNDYIINRKLYEKYQYVKANIK